jgi:hypothetical protein
MAYMHIYNIILRKLGLVASISSLVAVLCVSSRILLSNILRAMAAVRLGYSYVS